ncbi:cupin domain-containing protein [Natronolimnohabitans innermongolicus]|nr:cupin domain-containing protein [Natronolimnohabitans innermongolicus]
MERVSLEDCDPSEAAEGVRLALMAGGDEMTVQHFEIEPGAEVTAHSHDNEQTGFIYEGEIVFRVGGEGGSNDESGDADDDAEEIVCGPGDSYAIPGGRTHAAENRGGEPVRGVDIFSPPRENPSWQD